MIVMNSISCWIIVLVMKKYIHPCVNMSVLLNLLSIMSLIKVHPNIYIYVIRGRALQQSISIENRIELIKLNYKKNTITIEAYRNGNINRIEINWNRRVSVQLISIQTDISYLFIFSLFSSHFHVFLLLQQ